MKKSINSADMILIHVNAALILTDIQKKVYTKPDEKNGLTMRRISLVFRRWPTREA